MDGRQSVTRLISVITPCRNERAFVQTFVEGVFAQKLPHGSEVEVLLADGLSDDGTRELIGELEKSYSNLRLIENPERIVSTGLNAAVAAARGDIVVRMDVHTRYAHDYIWQCVDALDRSGADNVGGPWVAEGADYLSSAIASVFGGVLVSGGGKAHVADYEGPVDTVYLGCWRRDFLLRIGGFDEALVRNQDDELNLRILRSGGTVWQTPRIRSYYRPRSSVRALFRQYAQYGYWKVRVIRKHRLPASPRHVIPALFVGGLIGLAFLALIWKPAALVLFAILLAYAGVLALSCIAACVRSHSWRFLPVLPVIIMAFHFGYGYGFLRGILDAATRRRVSGREFSVLTRGGQGEGNCLPCPPRVE